MDIKRLTSDCIAAMVGGTPVSIVIPKGWKRPRGFPRGELLCRSMIDGQAVRVYAFKPIKMLNWLSDKRLIDSEMVRDCAVGVADVSGDA